MRLDLEQREAAAAKRQRTGGHMGAESREARIRRLRQDGMPIDLLSHEYNDLDIDKCLWWQCSAGDRRLQELSLQAQRANAAATTAARHKGEDKTDEDDCAATLRLKWSTKGTTLSNGGYTEDELRRYFCSLRCC